MDVSSTPGAYTSKHSYQAKIKQPEIWLRSWGFDILFVMGGAFFTLLAAAIVFSKPSILPVFFWAWVILFEGSHFWATLSRTYMDRQFVQKNKKLLFGSLVFFALPALALLLERIDPSVSYATLYGFFIFVWSLYHNARQHFGFTSIYCKKAQIQSDDRDQLVKVLYASIVIAQVYFLFNFKAPGTFSFSMAHMNSNLEFVLQKLPVILSLVTGAYFIYLATRLLRLNGTRSIPVISYIATCLLFYSIMFYIIAPADVFIQSASGAQKLMLIAIMNSLFHNIQYHAIVWHYSRERYAKANESSSFGWAAFMNSKNLNYFAFSLVLGGVFAFIVWNLAEWPNLQGNFTQNAAMDWAYVLFFGIIGHHFYLDQKIWRPGSQADLKQYLHLQK